MYNLRYYRRGTLGPHREILPIVALIALGVSILLPIMSCIKEKYFQPKLELPQKQYALKAI